MQQYMAMGHVEYYTNDKEQTYNAILHVDKKK